MANKSGIKIKKSHAGLFTKKAKQHGMGVQQFAKYVLAHKDKFPGGTRKQANFAKNAKKFKHQNGGDNPPVFTTPYEILKKRIKPLTQDYINYLFEKAERAQTGGDVRIPDTFRQYAAESQNYGPEPDLGEQEQQQFNQLYYNTFATPEQKTYAHNQQLQAKGLMVPPQRPDDGINPQNYPYANMNNKKQKGFKTEFNPVFKDFNTLAQITTGVANVFGDIKGKRKEHQDYLKSIQPRAYENFQEEGLNNIPVYTQEGGYGYQTGGGPNQNLMKQKLMELINNYNKYVTNATNRTATPLDMKVMEHMRQAIDSTSKADHFRMAPKESTMYPQYPLYGEPQALGKVPKGQFGMGYANRTGYPKNVWSVPGGWGKYVYGDDYVQYGGSMKKGGLTKEKAREILHDGTVHGKPITEKQRRYFGAVASGYAQTGGAVNVLPDEDYYKSNAEFAYYKGLLNDKLKAKNPENYDNYFKGLVDLRRSGKTKEASDYIQNTAYNDYLSPDEVKGTLGEQGYKNYMNSLKAMNTYNLQKGLQPLYGDIEGQKDLTNLNYGRRFASMTVTPSIATGDKKTGKTYSRTYQFNPKTNMVDIVQEGDPTLMQPKKIMPQVKDTMTEEQAKNAVLNNLAKGFKQYGGLNEGDEVELTDEEIEELRRQGYEFEDMNDDFSMFQ